MKTIWPLPPAFELVRELDSGAASTVSEAVQLSTGRPVALKVLHARVTDTATRRRFERECASMAALAAHPHIVTILDAGIHEGHPWIAMELCRGSLASSGRLSVPDVLDVLIATAQAMDATHSRGVLHCDLKPANILVTDFGSYAVADFGIARCGPGATTTSGTGYSLDFAAPEVLDGHSPTAATDVYCLGVTAWTLLSGRPPFRDGPDVPASAVIRRILLEPVPPPPPGTPDALATLMADMTGKTPADRVGSMAEVVGRAQEIRDHLEPDPAEAASPPLAAVTPPRPMIALPQPRLAVALHTEAVAEMGHTVYRTPRIGPVADPEPPAPRPRWRPRREDRPAHVLLACAGLILVGLLIAGLLAAVGVVGPAAVPARPAPVPPAPTPTSTGTPAAVTPSAVAPPAASEPPAAPAPTASTTTAGTDELGVGVAEANPACDGRYIVLVGSAVTPGRYSDDVAALLAELPDTSYVLTARSCGSFQDRMESGDLIYAVYLGPFDTLEQACATRASVGGDRLVRQLDTVAPTEFPVC